MNDTEDDGFTEEAFKVLDEGTPATPPATPAPATPPVVAEPPKDELPKVEPPKPAEEPKKDEEPAKKPEEVTPTPAADEKKPEDGAKPPETPAAPTEPAAPETPQPLTKDDVKSVVSDLLSGERASGKELETTTKEVLDAYYPDGLSNVLVDEKTGNPLKTPQDVVDASGGQMTTEEAAQWLMNEQYKLNTSINQIKDDAQRIADTTITFKRDAITAVQKYEPLFKAYPVLQRKAFDLMMKQVKADESKGVILQAPDVMDLYDTYLEPYQLAYEHATKESATNPVTPPAAPEPPKPGAEDRLDEPGDGGSGGEVNDPNDFAQQVTKELAKEL